MAESASSVAATFVRRNPVDASIASEAPAMTVAQACAVVDRAAAAFPDWSATGPGERRKVLTAAADALSAKAGELTALMQAETGAAPGWCHFNTMLAANMLREAGALTTQISGEVLPSDKPGMFSFATRQPAGVSLGIAPWNAPIILGTRAVAVALACGNAAMLKASELCPATHGLLAATIAGAGLPEGLLGLVTNAPADAPAVVEALIRHPAVRRVNFTGSTGVGRIIGRISGEELKPALLELGGKAPLLVLEDADIDLAVDAAAFGAFMHQGQICMSTERIIVVESVGDRFVEAFAAKVRGLRAGRPDEADAVLAALVDTGAAERVWALIEDAVGKGARLVTGGKAEGAIMQACVLDGVTAGMRIYHEESFGPSVSIIRVTDDDAAIATANDSEFGLSAAIISRDTARALELARRIESGICHINGPTVQDEAQVPFGGVKASGIGRFGGRWGIEFFTDTRWITIETRRPHFPF